MRDPIILSHVQAQPIVQARDRGESSTMTSLDLGLTTSRVLLESKGISFLDGTWLPWREVSEIIDHESVCFVVEDHAAVKVQRFSDLFNRFYSLMPTERAPTLLISGILMHRVKGIDPHQDTIRKVQTIRPITGRVLDTCTGLGYTAIEAAKTADQVTTIELDPTVLEVARLNPWSRQLFDDPKIQQVVGDSSDQIESFEDEAFSRIIHDPPTFSLAGDLYSGEFYRHIFRVVKQKGRVFHYIGDLESRSGRNVTRGVVRRLQEAGFSRIVRKPAAFGLVAYK